MIHLYFYLGVVVFIYSIFSISDYCILYELSNALMR